MGDTLDESRTQITVFTTRYSLNAQAAVPALFLMLMVGVPLLALGTQAWLELDANAMLGMVQDGYLQKRWVWSVLQAALSCAVVLALGVPVGWVLARYEFAGRALLVRALMLPFVVPTLLAALGVLALFGPRGLMQTAWGVHLQGTPYLLLYGNVFFNLCVVVRVAMDGFAQVGSAQIAAARSLGASPWRVFLRLELPLASPWIMGAASLVLLYCFSGFGLALILGGQAYATLEVEVYTLIAHELKLAQGSALALLCTVVSGSLAWLYVHQSRVLHSSSGLSAIASSQDAQRRSTVQTTAQKSLLMLALMVLALCCGTPLFAIVARAASAEAFAVLLEAETWLAVLNTVQFSIMSLALATVLGILHALAAQRSAVMRWAMWLPFLVSPVTVAFGALLAYPSAAASLPLLIAAYALLAYPFVAIAVLNALDALPVQVLQAASTLGASPIRVFWRVSWPLIQPAVRRGAAFAAASCVGEFAVSLFLSRPEWMTLTTLIYQKLGRPGAANLDDAWVLACLLMVLTLAAFVALDPPIKKSRLNDA